MDTETLSHDDIDKDAEDPGEVSACNVQYPTLDWANVATGADIGQWHRRHDTGWGEESHGVDSFGGWTESCFVKILDHDYYEWYILGKYISKCTYTQ